MRWPTRSTSSPPGRNPKRRRRRRQAAPRSRRRRLRSAWPSSAGPARSSRCWSSCACATVDAPRRPAPSAESARIARSSPGPHLPGIVEVGVDHHGYHRIPAGHRSIWTEQDRAPVRRYLQRAGQRRFGGQFARVRAREFGAVQTKADPVRIRPHGPGRRGERSQRVGAEPVGPRPGDDPKRGRARPRYRDLATDLGRGRPRRSRDRHPAAAASARDRRARRCSVSRGPARSSMPPRTAR